MQRLKGKHIKCACGEFTVLILKGTNQFSFLLCWCCCLKRLFDKSKIYPAPLFLCLIVSFTSFPADVSLFCLFCFLSFCVDKDEEGRKSETLDVDVTWFLHKNTAVLQKYTAAQSPAGTWTLPQQTGEFNPDFNFITDRDNKYTRCTLHHSRSCCVSMNWSHCRKLIKQWSQHLLKVHLTPPHCPTTWFVPEPLNWCSDTWELLSLNTR